MYLSRELARGPPWKIVAVVAHEFGHACTTEADVRRRHSPKRKWAYELCADWYAYQWGFGSVLRQYMPSYEASSGRTGDRVPGRGTALPDHSPFCVSAACVPVASESPPATQPRGEGRQRKRRCERRWQDGGETRTIAGDCRRFCRRRLKRSRRRCRRHRYGLGAAVPAGVICSLSEPGNPAVRCRLGTFAQALQEDPATYDP